MIAGILLLLKQTFFFLTSLKKTCRCCCFGWPFRFKKNTFYSICQRDMSEIILVGIKPKFIWIYTWKDAVFLNSCSTASPSVQPPGFHTISGQHGYNVSD